MDSSEELPESAEIDIAIIGMACRFPGADDVESFWRNLREGVESINFFTDEELLERGVPAEVLSDPHYIKAGAHLDHADCFDALFSVTHQGKQRKQTRNIGCFSKWHGKLWKMPATIPRATPIRSGYMRDVA